MIFSWKKYKKPILALAPIAGWTDSAYRQIIKSLTPEVVCFSELTSSNAIKYENEKTMKMLDFKKSEYPLIMQLFGKDPAFFVEAGKKLEQLGVTGIDINMGCPARKITHAEQGSALIKNPDLAAKIVHALTKAVKIPVSVKTRLGYDKYDPDRLVQFAQKMEAAGASLFTLHGRTTAQGFSGESNWDAVYLVKENLKIPVIGNGDITSAKIAKKRLKNLDGIMIGRATFGNPWIMAETYALLHGESYTPPSTLQEKIPLIIKHFKLSLKTKDEHYGVMEMRKHLGAYIRGFSKASKYRKKIMEASTSKEIIKILKEIEKIPS